MKHLQFIRTHFLLAVALLTAGITMSFSGNESESKKAVTVHYYVSNDMSPGAFRTVGNWSTTDNNVDCVTTEAELPCKIEVPANTSLGSILAGKNNDQVLDISDGYKPQL